MHRSVKTRSHHLTHPLSTPALNWTCSAAVCKSGQELQWLGRHSLPPPVGNGKLSISACGPSNNNKKHLKNVGPIRHCEPFYIAIHQVSLLSHAATVARRLRIDVYNDNNDDDNDNAWQRGPLWPHGMGPIIGDGGCGRYSSLPADSQPNSAGLAWNLAAGTWRCEVCILRLKSVNLAIITAPTALTLASFGYHRTILEPFRRYVRYR